MESINCSLQWEDGSGNGDARRHRHCHRTSQASYVIAALGELEGGKDGAVEAMCFRGVDI